MIDVALCMLSSKWNDPTMFPKGKIDTDIYNIALDFAKTKLLRFANTYRVLET